MYKQAAHVSLKVSVQEKKKKMNEKKRAKLTSTHKVRPISKERMSNDYVKSDSSFYENEESFKQALHKHERHHYYNSLVYR